MKIERKSGTPQSSSMNRDGLMAKGASTDSFLSVLSAQEVQVEQEELSSMIDHVVTLGETLVFAQSLEAVEAYRTAVKKLLDHIVKRGFVVKSATIPDRRGRSKVYMVFEEIDRHLLTLLQNALHHQLKPLEILEIVGEVKGLIISLQS